MSEVEEASPARRPRRRPRVYGAPSPTRRIKSLRPGTIRYRVLALLVEGKHTIDTIAALSGAGTASNAGSHCICLRRDFGVGYASDPVTGHWRALFAPGRTAEELLGPPPDLQPRPRGRRPVTVTNTAW
jgi:hypothetical protein